MVKEEKGKEFWFYGKTLVLKFTRSLVRMLSMEVGVQKIMILPTGSSYRKNAVTLLRKNGIYLVSSFHHKAMKKLVFNDKVVPWSGDYRFHSSTQRS